MQKHWKYKVKLKRTLLEMKVKLTTTVLLTAVILQSLIIDYASIGDIAFYS